MKTKRTFKELYSFLGFRAKARFKSGVMGDPLARIVVLERRQKKMFVRCAGRHRPLITTAGCIGHEMWTAEACGSMLNLNTGGFIVRRALP